MKDPPFSSLVEGGGSIYTYHNRLRLGSTILIDSSPY